MPRAGDGYAVDPIPHGIATRNYSVNRYPAHGRSTQSKSNSKEWRMSEDDKAQRQVNIGSKADTLLRDEAFVAACLRHKEELINAWLSTGRGDMAIREALWQEVNALDRTRLHLSAMKDGGKLAQRAIEEMSKRPRAS